jgi:two-component system competent response regulator ComA
MMITILLVDDHPSVVEGTRVMLEQEPDMKVTVAGSGEVALELLRTRRFDVILLDFNMPGISGRDLVKEILSEHAEAIILMYTGYNIELHYNSLLDAGISGVVIKTASKEKLVTAIRCALDGDAVIPISLFKTLRRDGRKGIRDEGSGNIQINDKDLLILTLLSHGKSNKEIAEFLITSQRTFEYALTQIFQKLNVKSRKEAVAKSKQLGILLDSDL